MNVQMTAKDGDEEGSAVMTPEEFIDRMVHGAISVYGHDPMRIAAASSTARHIIAIMALMVPFTTITISTLEYPERMTIYTRLP